MSTSTFDVISEAPSERAEEIRLVLEGLGLPEGRLSEEELERAVLAISARPELYEDLIVDDRESRWWLLLYKSPSYEVKLLTWEIGQSSDWHDHGGSSGAFAVTSGALAESYRGADYVAIESRTVEAGQHATFGVQHVHDVDFASGRPAVSVHAYSPPLSGLTFYDHTEFGFVAREFIPEEDRSLQRTTQPEVRR
jgi:hypothetical protein